MAGLTQNRFQAAQACFEYVDAFSMDGRMGAKQGPLVLLAEDSEITCDVVEALLAKRGLRAEITPDGMRAWRMAVNGAYAVILMDCQMPELDGWEATRRIRAAESGFHVPIIALTGCRGANSREQCLQAGMDDYLTKPLRGHQLYATIERWLAAPGSAS